MKIIGLDLGSRTCGIAVSDALGMYAHPLKTVRFEDEDYDTALDLVLKEIKENEIEKIVLGLPKHMNGDIGYRGELSQQFGQALQEESGLEVILWDERLTTVAAEKLLIESSMRREKRKKVIDQLAAVNILQAYLDSLH
jgi:putative Holliday junction resolvase